MEKSKIDEMRELVAQGKAVMEKWGFRFEGADPLVWKCHGDEILRTVITDEENIVVHYIYHVGGYLAKAVISFKNPKWREELEITLRIAMQDFVIHFLETRLQEHFGEGRFVIIFDLKKEEWQLAIYDAKRRTIIFSRKENWLKSPLRVFEDALQVIAVASL